MKIVGKVLLGLVFALVLIALLLPVFIKPTRDRRTRTLINLKRLHMGSMIYATDYDDHLPMAKNWQTDLYPYLKNKTFFEDDDLRPGPVENGFAYYKPLSGASIDRVRHPDQLPLFFVSDIRKPNPASGLETLPVKPRNPKGHAVVLLDGKVQFVPPDWSSTVAPVLLY